MRATQSAGPVKRSDPETGQRYTQLTSSEGSFHHLYFTSSSFTRDGRMVVIGTQDGNPNLFTVGIDDGELVRLTANGDGIQQSYIYFGFPVGRGFQKASPSFCPATNQALYILGAEVRVVDVDSGEETVVFTLPPEVRTAYTHLSVDGRYACVPYVPAAAFEFPAEREPIPVLEELGWQATDPFMTVRDRFGPEGLRTEVLVIELETGDTSRSFSAPGWVTHVQFSPADSRNVLFNYEGGNERPTELGTVEQRMWLSARGQPRRIRDERESPGVELFISHEIWIESGEAVVYHGSKLDEQGRRRQFVGRAAAVGGRYTEILLAPELTSFSHFGSTGAGTRLACDGVIDDSSLSICDVDWETESIAWHRICRHDTSWASQDVHPHPIFSADERLVAWSSDQHGARGSSDVYILDLADTEYERPLPTIRVSR